MAFKKNKKTIFLIIAIIIFAFLVVFYLIINRDNKFKGNIESKYVCYNDLNKIKYGDELSILNGKVIFDISGNSKNSIISKKIFIDSSQFSNDDFKLYNDDVEDLLKSKKNLDKKGLCLNEELKSNNKHYKNVSVNCEYDGINILSSYIQNDNIKKIVKELRDNDYECIEYYNSSKKTNEIIGKWCRNYEYNVDEKNCINKVEINFKDDGSFVKKDEINCYDNNKNLVNTYNYDIDVEFSYYNLNNEKITLGYIDKLRDDYYFSIDTWYSYDKQRNVIINNNTRKDIKENYLSRCD